MSIHIPGYKIVQTIGSGGMGIVYLANEENIETNVAIKLLHRQFSDQSLIVERFKNEARVMSSLVHPNIVQYRHFLNVSEGLALVMEYVDGRGLDRMIGEVYGPIPHEKAIPLFIQILQAVGYAHSKGVIHRDIKPSNILVSKDGEVKVTDFGIAKIAGQKGLTRTGTQMGTLYYEAPEQINGARDVDHRTDIYSLGMTLYEVLAGRLPFDTSGDASEFQVMNSIVNRKKDLDPRDHYPHVPEWLVGVVRKATAKEPDRRYQNCSEFISAFELQYSPSQGQRSYWSEKVASSYIAGLKHDKGPSVNAGSLGTESSCPNCGARITDDMEYCGTCGDDLLRSCPGCQERIRWHHRFCPRCGTDIEKKLAEIRAERERKRQEELRRKEEARLAEKRRIEEEKRRTREREKERQRRKLERERIEKKRRAARERRTKERQAKLRKLRIWWKKHWWKVTAATLIIVISGERLIYYTSEDYKYNRAKELEEEQKWEEAYSAFQSLNSYLDSEDRSLQCLYNYALELEQQGGFEEATELFLTLDDYRDSESHVQNCRLMHADEVASQGNVARAAEIISETRSTGNVNEQVIYSILVNHDSIINYMLPADMKFVRIPGGSFQMGGNMYSWELPVHEVNISSFEIMTTEVTQGMWVEIMGDSLEHQESIANTQGAQIYPGRGENYPMYYVSWQDCQSFIDELNAIDPSHVYRLPSEAEWEYACKAGTTTDFPWGNESIPDTARIYCWYGEDPENGSCHQVAQKTPNSWGVYDMCGNVWEWCEDTWHNNYLDAPADGSAWIDERRGATPNRIVRGGCWFNIVEYCRSANRGSIEETQRSNNIGFRVVRTDI